MRKWTRTRLGVSTVIANMLMISITLALAAILVAWTGTTYGVFSSSSQIYFVQRGQALQERFVIEAAFFNTTGSNHVIMIFVRNVGVLEINIVGIYINGRSLTPQGTGAWLCRAPFPVALGVAATCEFNLDWGSSWTPGTIFNIVVTSARGNRAVFAAKGI